MYKDKKTIEVELIDPDDQLAKIIDYIRKLSSPGHSFDVVVDPDSKENRKSFGIDGDGSFYIKKLEVNKMSVKVEELVDIYLSKI